PGAWASPAGARRSVASPRRGPRSCCAATTTRRAPSCSTGGWWSRRRAHCAGAHAAGDRPASTSSPSSRRRSTSPFSGGTPSAAAFGRRTHTRSPEPDASHQHNRSKSPVKFQDTKSQAQHRFPEAHMAPKFQGVDFYEVDGLLAAEERAVRDTVRAWIGENLLPVLGAEEQKRHQLPKMASGEVIGCFGLTEPDYGSNPAGMITVAKETADGWVLNGAKMWITNGSTAHVAIVWAKTGTLEDVESI